MSYLEIAWGKWNLKFLANVDFLCSKTLVIAVMLRNKIKWTVCIRSKM